MMLGFILSLGGSVGRITALLQVGFAVWLCVPANVL